MKATIPSLSFVIWHFALIKGSYLRGPDIIKQFSCSVISDSANPWTAAHQASLSFTISWSLFKFMSIESVMQSNHLILSAPFSCTQSFPASESFLMSLFFTSGGQSIGTSALASVLPIVRIDFL